MTGADVRAIRDRLGLSVAQFADLLGLEKNGWRTVQRWESGAIRITDRTRRQIEAVIAVQAAQEPARSPGSASGLWEKP